jgi:toxin ParE1/3/4
VKQVRFTQAAIRDVEAAAEHYEREREGLGLQFYGRLEEAVADIEGNAEGFEIRFEGLRRCNLRQFPYGLWYKILPDNSIVIACLHGKRETKLVRQRGRELGPA